MDVSSNINNLPKDDDQLIYSIRQGDSEALSELISRYKDLVRVLARKHYMAGAESDDIIQEGMIGLLSAVRTYSSAGGASFSTYANICIRNQIKTAIKAASRRKHLPLNNYLSIDGLSQPEGCSEALFQASASTPEETVIGRESMQGLQEIICQGLSIFEQQVLDLYIEGNTYGDIAKSLSKPVKSVDNAVGRCKKKLRIMQLQS